MLLRLRRAYNALMADGPEDPWFAQHWPTPSPLCTREQNLEQIREARAALDVLAHSRDPHIQRRVERGEMRGLQDRSGASEGRVTSGHDLQQDREPHAS